MYPQFFGQFLVKNGYLTNQQLLDALRLQNTFTMKVGELAVKHGYLTGEQVDRVIDKQRRVDKLFGDLAVELGFMTAAQLDEILTMQRSNHLYLGMAVVQKKFLSEAEIQSTLARYREEQHPEASLYDCLPADHPHHTIMLHLLDTTTKIFRRMLDLPLKIGKMHAPENSISSAHVMMMTELRGALDFDYYLNCDVAMSHDITSRMHMTNEKTWSDAEHQDCIGEFCNTITGILAGHLLEDGRRVHFTPPHTISTSGSPDFTSSKKAAHCRFPCATPYNTLELGIFFH